MHFAGRIYGFHGYSLQQPEQWDHLQQCWNQRWEFFWCNDWEIWCSSEWWVFAKQNNMILWAIGRSVVNNNEKLILCLCATHWWDSICVVLATCFQEKWNRKPSKPREGCQAVRTMHGGRRKRNGQSWGWSRTICFETFSSSATVITMALMLQQQQIRGCLLYFLPPYTLFNPSFPHASSVATWPAADAWLEMRHYHFPCVTFQLHQFPILCSRGTGRTIGDGRGRTTTKNMSK